MYPLYVDVNTLIQVSSILTSTFIESKLDIVIIKKKILFHTNMNGPFSHGRSQVTGPVFPYY